MESETLAYVAGIFDGEGCVTFGRVRKARFIRVLVVNTNRPLLEFLQTIFGGDIQRSSSRRPGWKQAWQWRLSWSRAIDFLDAIEPWIRVKVEQLHVAFAWDAIRPGRGKQIDGPALELLAAQLAWLNRRGGNHEPDPVSAALAGVSHAAH